MDKRENSNELAAVNKKLQLQNEEKEKRAAELIIANKELAYQNIEKEKRAAELIIANKELAYQNIEKEKRAAELIIANKELAYQNQEKEQRAAELIIANKELSFQNQEKEKRAAELIIANKELSFQNQEKEKRAAELIIANTELAFQNTEKEKRAAELIIANKELIFQNQEKEKRAAELIIANKELSFQNLQKEKRAAELSAQKKQLEDFCNIVSHNLRAPLVNIGMLVEFLAKSENEEDQIVLREQLGLSTNLLNEIFNELVESLQVKQDTDIKSDQNLLKSFVQNTCATLQGQINKSHAIIEMNFDSSQIITFPKKYLASILHNLISNSLKYAAPERHPVIKIETKTVQGNRILSVSDNGIGIDLTKHKDNLFKIRKVFHAHPDAKGFGLFITKSHLDAMGGRIWAESTVDLGTTFFVEFTNQNVDES